MEWAHSLLETVGNGICRSVWLHLEAASANKRETLARELSQSHGPNWRQIGLNTLAPVESSGQNSACIQLQGRVGNVAWQLCLAKEEK